MTQLVIQYIDNGIMILAAVLLLRYYFKPAAKRLYRKKWVLVVCILMMLYSVVELGLAYREHITSQIPSRASVEKTIQDSGQIVAKDFIFSSEDGYQVLIPAGYTYVASQIGGLSLTATKDHSAFIVFKMQDSGNLDRIMDKVLVAMRKRNPTFRLDNRRKIRINASEAVRIDCSAAKNNIPAKLILVLCQKGNTLFQLTFSCHQELLAELKAEYEKILTSFKIN